MNNLFGEKTAIVTGAARGIGKAIALAFAAQGARTVVHYGASKTKADETVREIETFGGEAFAIGADLRQVEQVKSFYDTLDHELVSRTGANKVDFLINNAGLAGFTPSIIDTAEEDFDNTFDLNVKGTFFMCQHAAPRLNDKGRIINFSSVVARGNTGAPAAYKAAKRAVKAITESLAGELGERGITVNAVAPGATHTDMLARADEARLNILKSQTAMKRIGQPDDIADFVVMLCRPEAAWVTGQTIEVSGGLNL